MIFDLEPAKKLLDDYLKGPHSQGVREALRTLDGKGKADNILTFKEIENFSEWYRPEITAVITADRRSLSQFLECSNSAFQAAGTTTTAVENGRSNEDLYSEIVAQLAPSVREKLSVSLKGCLSERMKGNARLVEWNAMVRTGNHLEVLVRAGKGLDELQRADLSPFLAAYILQTLQRQAVVNIHAFRESVTGKVTPDALIRAEVSATVDAINEILERHKLPTLAANYAEELLLKASKLSEADITVSAAKAKSPQQATPARAVSGR